MSYPQVTYPPGKAAGFEYSASPSQGGSCLTVNENTVTAASNPPTLGQAAACGAITGIVVKAPTGNDADLVLQTTGIFSVPVVASDGEGTEAVTVGALLYIASGVVSLIDTGVPFGYALAATAGSATAALIPVKLLTV